MCEGREREREREEEERRGEERLIAIHSLWGTVTSTGIESLLPDKIANA